MRPQFIANLALLQLCSFAAAATGANSQGSNSMVDTNGHHGTSPGSMGHGDHGSKPQGGHGAGMDGGKGGASSGHGSGKKGKGLPRMVEFPGVHISPASGGVVIPSDTVTSEKRAVASAVSSPDSDLSSDYDCYLGTDVPMSKRCSNFNPTIGVPDMPPSDCVVDNTCDIYGRSITDRGSATIEARKIPVPSGLSGGPGLSCPVIGRRGDFLIRRCPEVPSWIEEEEETEPLTMAIAK